MTSCDRFRGDLAAHLYGDLDDEQRQTLESHLADCAGCREELRALQRTSLLLSPEAMFPREREVDWEAFARSTVRRATGYRPAAGRRPSPAAAGVGFLSWLRLVMRAPGWAAVAAGLLVVVGAAVGTYSVFTLRSPEPSPVLVAEAAPLDAPVNLPEAMLTKIEATSAREGTRRYLAESRALLTSLLGTSIKCQKDTVDIRDERARSIDLLRRQRLIADGLESLPLARAKDVCRDLERLLLEIASLNDCAKAEQIQELKRLVESRQILFRLDLVADDMKRGSSTHV